MLILYDLNHNKIAPLPYAKEVKIERELTGKEVLSFSYPQSDSKYRLIQEECFIRTDKNEYVVKEINEDSDWTEYRAEINADDLKGNSFDTFESLEQSCTDAINLVLAGTGWSIGSCNISKKRTIRKSKTNAYDLLQEIQNTYICEMRFDAINKKVYIYQQMGNDKGAYFLNQLNLRKLNTQRNSYDFYTRIIPCGKDGLDISSVNSGKSYIDNFQYSNKVIPYYWEDNRYTDAQSLLEDSIIKLAEMSKPYRAYKADIIDLVKVNSKYKNILDYDLGDTITLIDKTKNIKDKQRIVKITEYPEEPEKNEIEIANIILRFDEIQKDLQDSAETVESITDSTGQVLGYKIDSIDASKVLNLTTANIQDFNAVTGRIGTLEATKANISDLNTTNANIANLTVNKANVNDLNAAVGRISTLETSSATITQLNASNANISTLQSNVASINNVLAGNVGASNLAAGAIQSGSAVIAAGAIGSAQISDLSASKLTVGTIDAAIITVKNLTADNITAGTINGQRIAPGAIDNSKVATTANIDGSKLNISSVVTAINGNTTTIQASKIALNSSTLDVQFSNINQTVTSQGQTISSQSSQISANASAIALKVDTQTYNTKMSSLDGSISTINNTLSTQSSSISVLQGQIATKVSQTEVNNSINAVQLGGRNLFKNSALYTFSPNGTGLGTSVQTSDGTGTFMRATPTPGKAVSLYYFMNNFTIPLQTGKTYSMSFDVRTNGDTPIITYVRNGNNTAYLSSIINQNVTNSTWTRIKVEGFTCDSVSNSQVFLIIALDTVTLTLDYRNFKLEQGNKATDWSPAPEDVQSQIDAATTRISTAESTITQQSNLIATKVTQTDVQTSINSLQIGGRNLLKNTNSVTDIMSRAEVVCAFASISEPTSVSGKAMQYTFTSVASSTARGLFLTMTNWGLNVSNLNIGDTLTFSFYAKASRPLVMYCYANGMNNSNSNICNITTSWSKFTYTFTITNTASINNIHVFIASDTTLAVGDIQYFHSLKLEKGTKATDWTPAPEDVQGQIDGLGTRMTTAESSITQNANSIALKVSKDSVISTINQSAEAIKIQASKLELSGYATFTNLSTAGQTVINAGNITTGTMTADKIRGGTLTLGGADLNTNGRFQLYNKAGQLILDSDTLTPLATQFELAAKGEKAYGVYTFSHASTVYIDTFSIYIPLGGNQFKYGSITAKATNTGRGGVYLNICKNSSKTQYLSFYGDTYGRPGFEIGVRENTGYAGVIWGNNYPGLNELKIYITEAYITSNSDYIFMSFQAQNAGDGFNYQYTIEWEVW